MFDRNRLLLSSDVGRHCLLAGHRRWSDCRTTVSPIHQQLSHQRWVFVKNSRVQSETASVACPFHLWPLYSVASSFFVLFTAFSNLTWQRRFFLYAVMSICEGVGFQRIRRWLLERLYFPRQDSVFWNKGARRSPWPLAKCESNWIH